MRLRELEPLEMAMRAVSPLGPFLEGRELFPWVRRLEDAVDAVTAEYLAVQSEVDAFPGLQEVQTEQVMVTRDQGWQVLLLLGYQERFARTCARFPQTMALLDAIPEITTAFFSRLVPGKRIPMHQGPWGGVLRVHLPVVVPRDAERCWIEVAGERRTWQRGRCLAFDDSFPHQVHNDTDETRVVLFLDVVRPLPEPWHQKNMTALNTIRSSSFVADAAVRYRHWEAVHL